VRTIRPCDEVRPTRSIKVIRGRTARRLCGYDSVVTGDIEIECPAQFDDDLFEALTRLIPQLSRSANLTPALLRDLLAHDATILVVARLHDRIVGVLTLVIYPLPTGKRAHIDDVVVDQSARGHGVGGCLVKAAIAISAQHGVRTVDLTSRPSRNAAIRLYTGLGFKQRDSHIYRYEPPDG
jgi:ribosomal protein S18 acetylase RimI-like enzyme